MLDTQAIKQRFGIIGNSEPLNRGITIAMQVASTDLSVLITGESGVGKEFFPKIIHELSSRKHNSYVAINCGAIPEGTINSELFGHEKGSFTDAREARRGYFEEANNGTIFLDEVAELPLSTQVRLLRVLETGEFLKVGSSKVQKTNVRVVAATNVNIADAIQKGRFREDLYYRLNTITIQVPSLKERKEDIELLFRKFSTDIGERYRIPPLKLTEDAREYLINYPFPGNIRQLKNVAEQITIVEKDRNITLDMLRSVLPPINRPNALPALFSKTEATGMSERDILYKVLFDMQKDIQELKRSLATRETLRDDTTTIVNNEDNNYAILPNTVALAKTYPTTDFMQPKASSESDPIVQHINIDSEEEFISEQLNLEEREKLLIEKALQKHSGNRRKAAEDLGISERTIYRKINDYNINLA